MSSEPSKPVAGNSYRHILKSSTLIGGASLITMVVGMIRTKFVAELLGPQGVGLIGVYTSISTLATGISNLGLGTSGVRFIAEANGAGDQARLAQVVKSVQRTVWLAGFVGMLLLALSSSWVSRFSFGSIDYAIGIAVLGVTVLMANVASGQACLLQGTRKIADIAKVSIIGAINGTILSIPCYYVWGIEGIVPGLVLTGAAALATSWWYARRVPIVHDPVSWKNTKTEAGKLIRLGIPLMVAGVVGAVGAYAIRSLLIQKVGLDNVGIWQAATNLSTVLAGFVLGAMAADYYPRLTAVATDNARVSEEVNAQTEIGLFLGTPGLAATIMFAPVALHLFYSAEFEAAEGILRWSTLGVFFRVVSWPLGFVMLAKGRGKLFLVSEVLASILYFVCVWVLTGRYGLVGSGMAFFVLYLLYTLLVYAVTLAINRSHWTRGNILHIGGFFLLLCSMGLVSSEVLNLWVQYSVNTVFLVVVSIYCINRLAVRSGLDWKSLINRVPFRR